MKDPYPRKIRSSEASTVDSTSEPPMVSFGKLHTFSDFHGSTSTQLATASVIVLVYTRRWFLLRSRKQLPLPHEIDGALSPFWYRTRVSCLLCHARA